MTFVTQRGSGILERLPSGPVVGAEVGVWDGRLSKFLLGQRDDMLLYMVDRWKAVPEGHSYRLSESSMAAADQETFDEVYSRALEVATGAGDRAVMMRGESVDVAQSFADKFMDFVFVDAEHTYTGVLSDLKAWVPKLRSGGWACGHDWEHPDHVGVWGVANAVLEYFGKQADVELGANRTWFMRV